MASWARLVWECADICSFPVVSWEPPFIQHLRASIGQVIRVVIQAGQAGALVDLTGTLQDVFSDHILLIVGGIPRHVRIATISWFEPAGA